MAETLKTEAIERQACAHLRVRHDPLKNYDGSQYDRWTCFDCRREFWPVSRAELDVLKALAEQRVNVVTDTDARAGDVIREAAERVLTRMEKEDGYWIDAMLAEFTPILTAALAEQSGPSDETKARAEGAKACQRDVVHLLRRCAKSNDPADYAGAVTIEDALLAMAEAIEQETRPEVLALTATDQRPQGEPLEERECGTATPVITSTKEDSTASTACTSGLLLPDAEWEQLSAESKAKIQKWFQLATEHLQAILDAEPPAPQPLGEADTQWREEALEHINRLKSENAKLREELNASKFHPELDFPLTPTGSERLRLVEMENAQLRSEVARLTEELSDEYSADAQIQDTVSKIEDENAQLRESLRDLLEITRQPKSPSRAYRLQEIRAKASKLIEVEK